MNFKRYLGLVFVFISTMSFAEQSFKDFVKGKELNKGYYSFYYDKSKAQVFLEVKDTSDAFIFQSSLPHGIGSNDIGLDRGQLGDTRLVQFERVGDKVLLRQLNTYYRAETDNLLERQAIDEAFASSIIWGFKVVSENPDNNSVVIDYTPFLFSDIHGIGETLKSQKQGSFSIDKSRSFVYKKRTKAFPENTELEATITFKGKGTGKFLKSVTPEADAVTVNLHHSLIKLPDNGYKKREFHPFSGFWAESYADYATAIDEPIIKRFIPRHRLAKKDPSAQMSEAVEPIVYYLDAGVPEPVKSALLDGARWWEQAFEAIGYKNAYQVKMLPADADPMDVRYNVIQWVHRATRGWSYGSSVIDPRTGEIIKGHVTLGSLRVRQDYLIALGLTSPFKSENTDTSAMKEMALARIRQLSAHEVGHTLGIAHNFAASVNDRASVMDYPHPYIQLKGGQIDLSKAYDDKIGEWDKHVVAYGYADVAPAQESQFLKQTIAKARAKGLLYVSDPDARPQSGAHNTGHLWDNGKNPAEELDRVLKVREHALANFGENSIPAGTPFSQLEEVLVPIYNFHRYQVEAAVKLIAGVDYQYQVKGDANQSAPQAVTAKEQNKALASLMNTLSADVLTIPQHIVSLIPPKSYGYSRTRESFKSATGLTFDPISAAQSSAKHTISLVLNKGRLARLAQQNMMDSDIPSVDKVLATLVNKTIKQSPPKAMQALVQQRVNSVVVERLLALYQDKRLVPEVRADIYQTLTSLEDWLTKSKSKKYRAFKDHYNVLALNISSNLGAEQQHILDAEVRMPPGSPIGQ